MELSDGMVAVVRGLPDAALCVTLLDGARQYTLLPNAARREARRAFSSLQRIAAAQQVSSNVHSTQKPEHTVYQPERMQYDSSVQAADGQYASTYQTSHCHVRPTSPPVQLTEFPPQRAELCAGHGNFQVGGLGSGKSVSPPRGNSGCYRGGMSWPDRGSVCSPRPSHEPNAFADSLRKYPNMSPERSTEVVERLINYTQMKNSTARSLKTLPNRSESSTVNCERPSRNCSRQRYEAETPEESPHRDRRRDEGDKPGYGRSYDVRYVRDLSKRARDTIKNFSTYPYSHPVCPTIKERYDHLPPESKRPGLKFSNSVNMETQAEIPMISREMTTNPIPQPSVRNVAIPLTPTASTSEAPPDRPLKASCSTKSIQTARALDLTLKIRKSAQTCFSSVDLLENKKVKNKRKSKSQEELRVNDDFEEEIVQLIHDLTSCPDIDKENILRIRLLRKLRRVHKIDRSERVKIKIGRCIKDQMYSEVDLKNFTRELSNELISKIRKHNIFISSNPDVYRADVHQFKARSEENCVDEIIKEWLDDIPIKPVDYLGRDVMKGRILHTIAEKIRTFIINKFKYNSDSTIKADIIKIIEDIPIDVNGHNKRLYLNRLVSELMRKIKDTLTPTRRRWRKATDHSTYIQSIEKELRQFVSEELAEFTEKFNLKICQEPTKQIEMELTDIIMDSLENVRLDNVADVKEDILVILADYVSISEQQAIYFVNNFIYNLRDMFSQSNNINEARPQTFIVLQNDIIPGTSKNDTEHSIEGITESDIDANLDYYTNQIVEQINEWSVNIIGFEEIDPGFRQVAINDLAGDIVDRHKYLELNPSSKNTDKDELEHLKYQIFKWINKVVGEGNLDTIEHASELMTRIRGIPVPMLTKPNPNYTGSGVPKANFNLSSNQERKKPENVQSTSKGRRFSSPNPMAEQSGSAMFTAKNLINQNRRQSSPDAMFTTDCCKNTQFTQSDSLGNETTESRFNKSHGVTSTPIKKGPYSVGTDTSNMQMWLPGPNAGILEPPIECCKNSKRSLSESIGILSPKMGSNASHRSNLRNSNEFQSSSRHGSPSRSNKVNCSTNTSSKGALVPDAPSVDQLNDEYNEFVKNWVQQIPIATSSPEEQALAEKARLGIYNGIWKIILKLKMSPSIIGNPFYYQDIFDDELEDLLSCLPQTKELVSKKHILKANLIEKTTDTNALTMATAAPSTYKQQLVDNVSNNIPRNSIDYTGKNEAKLYEEMQKMNLAENFILYIKYRDDDKVKANVFKKKLMREVQQLINGFKANCGRELKDIKAATYIDEVIEALQKVPLPSKHTIEAEADEIAVGLEIEQWFSDLPLLPNDAYAEKLGRRRYKDALAKKIHDMEKYGSLADNEKQVRDEIRRFLERMPLRANNRENIDFMVEELVNRLKNRTNDIVATGGERKKSVAFVEAYDYDEFSRDMPICSSFSDSASPAQANQSSYMIADGTRVKDPYYVLDRNTPDSQQQWYTLEETLAPKSIPDPKDLPPCCRSQVGGQPLPQPQNIGQSSKQYSASSQTPTPASIRERTESQDAGRFHTCHPEQRNSTQYEEYRRGSRNSEHSPQRYDHSPQRFEGSHVSRSFAPEIDSHGHGPGGYDRPNTCDATCTANQAAPASYRPEGSTKPVSSASPDRSSPRVAIPSSQFSREPIGYSTPQNQPQPNSSRPKKRVKEVEQQRKDAARRRLELEDTENNSEDEVRCRCMEKVWRCRRKKPMCPTCAEPDYVPCFMRFPTHPYYF